VVEAVYSYPYQSHSPMEPMNATALYTQEKCEVWCPTQNSEAILAAVAETSGLPVGKCDVDKTLLGGGFGRRVFTDYARQAVRIAMEMPGMPVKLMWSREEDMTHDFYHPITQCKLLGGLDTGGNLVGFQMRISGQSILATVLPQNLKDGLDPAVFQGLNPGCPPGPYERASLIAYYLKTKKPRSKVLVLDAKDAFSKQKLFQQAWQQLYPGLLEWVSLSSGRKVTSVDPAAMTVTTDFQTYKPAIANIIPAQKAGRIAEAAGVVDRTGWCPIDPTTFE
jgi:flavocytochrome c sulfide dehydrogenase-like protein/molybdopterin-binding aldehyde dehydrogenase-like protein